MATIETLTARFRPHAAPAPHESLDVLATVEIRSDDYHFQVYDDAGRPIGSIHRPRRDGADGARGKWSAYRTDGRTVVTSAPGPRIALLRIARQVMDENGLAGTVSMPANLDPAESEAMAKAAPAKQVESIDMTPTWEGLLAALLAVYCDGNADGRKFALAELTRMAKAADSAVAKAAPAPRPEADSQLSLDTAAGLPRIFARRFKVTFRGRVQGYQTADSAEECRDMIEAINPGLDLTGLELLDMGADR